MNGGGGGSSLPTSSRHEFDCLKFFFDTSLEHVPDALIQKQRTVLEVFREDTEAGPRLVAIDADGQVVGRITSNVGRLLECMDLGVAFIAVVKAVTLLVHEVTIRASSIKTATRKKYQIDQGNPGDSRPLKISDRSDPEAVVMAGSNVLEPHNICELRSLVRVGVELLGTVKSVNTLEVEAL